jgi:hypothetical protein
LISASIAAQLSGTSTSAPQAAGLIAYLISMYGNPTPEDMKYWLRAAGGQFNLGVPLGKNSTILSNCYGRDCFRPYNITAHNGTELRNNLTWQAVPLIHQGRPFACCTHCSLISPAGTNITDFLAEPPAHHRD